jgi:hypothetical protein
LALVWSYVCRIKGILLYEETKESCVLWFSAVFKMNLHHNTKRVPIYRKFGNERPDHKFIVFRLPL